MTIGLPLRPRKGRDKARRMVGKAATAIARRGKDKGRAGDTKVEAATAIARKGRAAAVMEIARRDRGKAAGRAATLVGRARRAGRGVVRPDNAIIVRRRLPQARRRGQNRKTRTLHNLRWAAETVATLVGANIRAIIALGAVCLTGSKNAKKRRSPKTT